MFLVTSLVVFFCTNIVSSFCLWKISQTIQQKMSRLADYSTSVRQFGDRYPSSQSPGVGCVHYFEYFLERGILGAKHLRLLTRPLWLTFSLKKRFQNRKTTGRKERQSL